MQKYDLLIVGGGMVGLTLALAVAKQSKLKVAVVDDAEPQALTAQPELRVSAINGASRNIFEHLGVWQSIIDSRFAPYDKMHVWEKAGWGKIEFDNRLTETDELGWIIENKVIRQALWSEAEREDNIALIRGEKIAQLAIGESEVFASFNQQPPITAKLIVGADGARSWVREQCDIPLTFWDYDHHAIVGTVKCEYGHDNTAWQVFLPDGPLALLPLYDTNLCSIVWSQPPSDAEHIQQMNGEAFAQAITAATDGKLGLITLESELACYPLTMRYAREFVKQRVALVGDAAHTIHPLAGQGVNLGLLDAASLAQIVIQAENSGKDIGELSVLTNYGRWRKAQATDMIAAMEAIKRAFTAKNAVVKTIRGIGMSLLNDLEPLKRLMVKQAIGDKADLPTLALPCDPLA